jgi:DNA anti-recombination protein RmuC
MDGTKLNKRQLKRTLISIRDKKMQKSDQLKKDSATNIIKTVINGLESLSNKLNENETAEIKVQLESLNKLKKILESS